MTSEQNRSAAIANLTTKLRAPEAELSAEDRTLFWQIFDAGVAALEGPPFIGEYHSNPTGNEAGEAPPPPDNPGRVGWPATTGDEGEAPDDDPGRVGS